MTRGGMLDVVLAEDDDEPAVGHGPAPAAAGAARAEVGVAPAGSGGTGGRAGPGNPPGRARRRRLALLALAVALVAAGVVGDRPAPPRADRSATVTGMLSPLDGGLRELWRAPGGTEHAVTSGGGLVLATFLTPAGHVLVATEATSGAQRWTAPLPELPNTRDLACVTVGPAARGVTGVPAWSGPARHVVCRVVTQLAGLADGAQGFAASALLVLDARTGDRVAERPLDSRVSTLAVAGRDLLVTELRRDGHGTVMREDPVTGDVLWTFRTPRPLPDLGDGLPVAHAQLRHGTLVVDGPAGWALTPAGSVRGEWQPVGTALPPGVPRAIDLTVLPGGRLAVTDATRDGAGAGEPVGEVVATAAAPAVDLPGRVLTPVVDDGSAPDLVLTVPVGAGQVVAVDLRSGRERWRAQTRAGGQAVLVDSRLVLLSGRGGVRAIDVRTGDVLWVAAPDVVSATPQLVTDGDVVLVPVLADRRPTLVALGVADGRERWRAPVPTGIRELSVLDGRLLALTDRETVALG